MSGADNGNGPIVYLESNVFIYFVEAQIDVSRQLKPLFEAIATRPGSAVTSELTLAEVMAPTSSPSAPPLAVRKRAYLSPIVWNRSILLKPVTRDILYDTVELRRAARLRLPDAIHLATAIQSDCRYFLSSDRDFKAMPQGMTPIRPGHDSLAPVIEALA